MEVVKVGRAALEERVDSLNRQVGWITKGNLIHVYGSEALELLYTQCVETEDGGGYKRLKAKARPVLAKEVALFLGYG